jgi:hypothetical protein
MPYDPKHPLNEMEKKVFGANARRHPITGMVLECGSGALPDEVQAAVVHVAEIERQFGKEAADAVRAKLHMASRPLANKKD